MSNHIDVRPDATFYFKSYKGYFISAEKDEDDIWSIKVKARIIYDKNLSKSLDYIMTSIDMNMF